MYATSSLSHIFCCAFKQRTQDQDKANEAITSLICTGPNQGNHRSEMMSILDEFETSIVIKHLVKSVWQSYKTQNIENKYGNTQGNSKNAKVLSWHNLKFLGLSNTFGQSCLMTSNWLKSHPIN